MVQSASRDLRVIQNGNSAQVGEEARDAHILFLIFGLDKYLDELPMVSMEGLKVNWPCSCYVRKYSKDCIHTNGNEVSMLLH